MALRQPGEKPASFFFISGRLIHAARISFSVFVCTLDVLLLRRAIFVAESRLVPAASLGVASRSELKTVEELVILLSDARRPLPIRFGVLVEIACIAVVAHFRHDRRLQ